MGLSVGEDKSNTLIQRTPDGYNHLEAAIAKIAVEIPEAKEYATALEVDVLNTEGATKTGDRAAVSRALTKFAKDLRAGAHTVGSNPELYHLADNIAPAELRQLAGKIVTGEEGSLKAVDNLMEQFAQLVVHA
ncbi:hypothetical protein PENARI_c039G07780 [Penicillium arizonense]|uniref:Uncharacterized protein n=1 Tax=Penicillium arizonense TaxID=1835702 RepID=A0A1F5L3N2_PENAI|nr:hypothetical protein PENARI_c039G07780 [Penicillium arizonense]OGE47667.1 hypothetical protein PENARI_c039G07780 [Penicillium arizonense]